MDNIMVIYDNLPTKVKGFTMHNAGDDYYTIILNSRMSHECLLNTYKHELRHICRNDFACALDVNIIENVVHK